QPVSQLDIFHTINLEAFVETTNVQQYVRQSRNVARMVIRKIDRAFFRRIRMENLMIAQIPQEWIGRIAPRQLERANYRCIWIFQMPIKVSLNERRRRLHIVVDK